MREHRNAWLTLYCPDIFADVSSYKWAITTQL